MRQGRSAPLPATDPNDRCEATHIRRLDVGVQARLRNTWLRRQLAGRRWEGVRPAVRVAACMRVRLGASQAALASPPPASQPSRIQDCGDRLIGLVDRIYSARYDGGVCPHSNQLCEIIVHFGEQRWPAIVRNDFLYLSVPSGTTASKRSISLSLPMYCGMTTS